MAFNLSPDGTIRGTIEGRQYVGKAATGGASDLRYRRVQALMASSGLLRVIMAGGDAYETAAAKSALLTAPGAADLARETLDGFSVTWTGPDGIEVRPLPAEWDRVYQGRGWEPSAAAVEVWAAEGFLLPPGMTPGQYAEALARSRAAQPPPATSTT
jgi:hypothetical protein